MADEPEREPGLERLDVFVGSWELEVILPIAPNQVIGGGRSVFEWLKTRRLLVQRTWLPAAEAPDGVMVVVHDPANDDYRQHYFDSRGVARLCRMTFDGLTWTLLRTEADFSPLEFCQRFTGSFSDDGDLIRGRWEKSTDGVSWELDFDLTYRRVKGPESG